MANEITTTFALQLNKNGEVITIPFTGQFDMTGDHWSRQRIDVGTTEEELEDGDVAVQGFMFFRARSTNTAAIRLGTKPSGTFVMHTLLKPGQAIPALGNPTNKWWAQSVSGTQILDAFISES